MVHQPRLFGLFFPFLYLFMGCSKKLEERTETNVLGTMRTRGKLLDITQAALRLVIIAIAVVVTRVNGSGKESSILKAPQLPVWGLKLY